MNSRILILFVALLAAPAIAFAQQHGNHAAHTVAAPSDAEQAVRAVVLGYAAALERGDISALDTFWSAEPGAMIIEGAGADTGWENYREHHLKPELAAFEGLRYRYDNVKVNLADHLAWASFDYTLQGKLQERDVDVVGKGTMILRHTADDGWRIVHSHTSGKPRAK